MNADQEQKKILPGTYVNASLGRNGHVTGIFLGAADDQSSPLLGYGARVFNPLGQGSLSDNIYNDAVVFAQLEDQCGDNGPALLEAKGFEHQDDGSYTHPSLDVFS